MPCNGRKNKKFFLTRQRAEQEVKKARHYGCNFYVYACGDHFHLATVKKPKPTSTPTKAEIRHLKNRVADVGRQIANEEWKAAKKKVAELAPIVAEDREWLRRMKDAAEFNEACASALRKLLDTHFASAPSSSS